MVEVMKSSFIPKKEIKKKTAKRIGRSGINIFFLLSLLVFLMSVLGWAFVYFQKNELITKIKEEKDELQKNKDLLKINLLTEPIMIGKKTKAAKELLLKHYNLNQVFIFLQRKTIPKIYFDSMTIQEEDDYITFEFKGRARQFSDLIIQKDWYVGKKDGNPNVEDFAFTNITRLKEEGGVEFNMSFKVNKIYLTKKPFIGIKK